MKLTKLLQPTANKDYVAVIEIDEDKEGSQEFQLFVKEVTLRLNCGDLDWLVRNCKRIYVAMPDQDDLPLGQKKLDKEK